MDVITSIDSNFIEKTNNFKELIGALKTAFSDEKLLVPLRHHHDFPNPEIGKDSTLLLMPAWNPGFDAGVKVVTVSPENKQFDLPSIQGVYIYLDVKTGAVKAILDAKALTVKRTAAASGLASSFLSRTNSQTMLMIGTGALAPNLIKAHTTTRPIREVFVWGRDYQKAKKICEDLKNNSFSITPVKNIKEKIVEVDIISCATMSKTPLVFGKYLRAGQHLDLVGAYKKDMREADDETIKKSSVFVDTFQGGLKESGDVLIPLQTGILKEKDIKADLFQLCTGKKPGRNDNKEITVFKSVGHALEDLAAAKYFYQKHRNSFT